MRTGQVYYKNQLAGMLSQLDNGSFVFGLDEDDKDVFKRTVDWGVENAITTSTYHVLTPYPGTKLYEDMEQEGRILTKNWDLYDTRNVVYKTNKLTAEELKNGYDWAYKEFYSWKNIVKSSLNHESNKHKLKHFFNICTKRSAAAAKLKKDEAQRKKVQIKK